MKNFGEEIRVEKGLLADVNGGADSARIDMKEANKVSIVVSLPAAAGATLDVKVQEHTLIAAGVTKDVLTSVPYYAMIDADTKMTKYDAVAGVMDASGALDADAGLMVIEIDEGDLTDGYQFVSLNFANGGFARVVSVNYMVDTKRKPAYEVEL